MARSISFQVLMPTLVALACFDWLTLPANGVVLEWTRQLGTSGSESETKVSADGLGNVYISGYTSGTLNGANAGATDAFISRFDASGNLLWTRQFGTPADDPARGVSADGLGNVYISGNTWGSLGGPSAGETDAFVSKYDASGTRLWSRQLGTSTWDFGRGVSADGLGNVYLVGDTDEGSLGGPNAGGQDAFVSKFDASGTRLWTRQLGTSLDEVGLAVSADGLGNVYLAGSSYGGLGGSNAGDSDAYVSKFDGSGNWLWTRQIGTSSFDSANDVSSDGLGNVYIAGDTGGSLGGPSSGGTRDAFVSKYDASGSLLWTRQLGTSSSDLGRGVSADGLGNVYLSGNTGGSLGGPNAGGSDAFVAKFDASGNWLWTRQYGTSSSEYGTNGIDASADGLGNVYISGDTQGSLGGPNAGSFDSFVAKISDISSATPGDFDLDGDVDGHDVLVWQRNPDVGDLADWQANFGAGSVVGANAAVPEPSAYMLSALAIAGVGLGRKHGQHPTKHCYDTLDIAA